jgi:hypothetical protein
MSNQTLSQLDVKLDQFLSEPTGSCLYESRQAVAGAVGYQPEVPVVFYRNDYPFLHSRGSPALINIDPTTDLNRGDAPC